MRSVITQSVTMPAQPDALFEMYMDAGAHAAITGAPVTISKSPGAEFSAFGGALSGTMLFALRPTLIVQSWRSTAFKPDDLDSTLILQFKAAGSDGQIDLVHLDVPDHDYEGVVQGWEKYYWTPWREYLRSTRS